MTEITPDCFQSVKVKKFESNSQPKPGISGIFCTVFRVSKLKSLKAIHNELPLSPWGANAVFRVSKLKSLKAIHNAWTK